MTIRYISTAAGLADGSSWDNAAGIGSLAAFYTASQPSDEIWIASTVNHSKTSTTAMVNANNPTSTTRIRIRGMRPYGTTQGWPEKATIIGNRTAPWPVPYLGGGVAGGTLFEFGAGSKHTTVENLIIMNHDIAVKLNHADNAGIHVQDCEFINVRAGVSTLNGLTTGLRVRRVMIAGFTLYGLHVSGTVNDVVFEDVNIYQLNHDDNDIGNSPTGVILDVACNNIRVRRVRAYGGFDKRLDANYWQGEGFSAEEDCYNIVWEDCYASDWTDAGWDIKSSNSTLLRCVAERNKRNFRLWPQSVAGQAGTYLLEDCVSRYPIYRGGSGTSAHLWVGAGTIGFPNSFLWKSSMGSRIEDHASDIAIVNIESGFTSGTIQDTVIRKHPSSALQTPANTVTFTNNTTETEE